MDKQAILKKIESLKMGTLNLEIQSAQIENDSAAKGAMVATEHIKRELEELEALVNAG